MFTLLLWTTGLLIMALLLGRAYAKSLVLKYPLFYIYLTFVLFTSSFLLLVYLMESKYYGRAYWYIEFLGAVLGCFVVWEIYRSALRYFPGAARMARKVQTLIIAIVLARAIAEAWNGTSWWPSQTMIELERDLRGVQAGLLIALVIVILSYRIPMGPNVWGMMLGYGLLIGSNVITLTFRALLGDSFQIEWLYLQPLSYITVLCIWSVALWSYRPAPEPNPNPKIEQDYKFLIHSTTKALLQARTSLRKTLRP
jgi:xanthosine utilization system XapX-like protein